MKLYGSTGKYHRERLHQNGEWRVCKMLREAKVTRRVSPARFARMIAAGLVCRVCARGTL